MNDSPGFPEEIDISFKKKKKNMIGALKKGQWNRAHATMDSTIFSPVFLWYFLTGWSVDRCNNEGTETRVHNFFPEYIGDGIRDKVEDLSHTEGQL